MIVGATSALTPQVFWNVTGRIMLKLHEATNNFIVRLEKEQLAENCFVFLHVSTSAMSDTSGPTLGPQFFSAHSLLLHCCWQGAQFVGWHFSVCPESKLSFPGAVLFVCLFFCLPSDLDVLSACVLATNPSDRWGFFFRRFSGRRFITTKPVFCRSSTDTGERTQWNNRSCFCVCVCGEEVPVSGWRSSSSETIKCFRFLAWNQNFFFLCLLCSFYFFYFFFVLRQ